MPSVSENSMNIIITGAAGGIGRYLARSFVAKGHCVFLMDNNANGLADTHSILCRNHPGREACWTFSHTDLASLPAIRDAVVRAKAFFPSGLDLLINNAMAMPHTLPESSNPSKVPAIDVAGDDAVDEAGHQLAVEEHWDRQLAVGLSAPFHLSRLCIPLLRWGAPLDRKRAQGSIINISSTRARMAEWDHEGYSAVKAGLLGLSRAMSVSLGAPRGGIRVNSLVLGWVHCGGDDELSAAEHEWHPAGRVGRGEDVLRAVEYLAGASWVTGEEMVLDGGVTRKMVYPEEPGSAAS